ncbi:LpqB family beta-propeller domain-containing protein, partial [Actinacidiphila rubida]
ILHADGTSACQLPSSQAEAYGPANLVGSTTRQYYIKSDTKSDTSSRLMELAGDATASTQLQGVPVSGPFGGDKADLESVAVRRDEQAAAGVRSNGRQLVVAPLQGSGALPAPVLTSKATDPKNGLSQPSWDGLGDLWVADRTNVPSQLKVVVDGRGLVVPVTVPDLTGRVESLKVASDGVRIALIVDQRGGMQLQVGRIQRGGTPAHPTFSVTGLRTLPAEDDVTSVAWAGASRLVVLANQSGVQQIEYMSTDGSAVSALQGVSEAASVAASEDQSRPLLAAYNGSVYLLPADTNWKQITPKGFSPVYPG